SALHSIFHSTPNEKSWQVESIQGLMVSFEHPYKNQIAKIFPLLFITVNQNSPLHDRNEARLFLIFSWFLILWKGSTFLPTARGCWFPCVKFDG
ncbi:MAG: hypothetical protein WA347_00585, partial [Rhabdochlamydiaceae bacterium]